MKKRCCNCGNLRVITRQVKTDEGVKIYDVPVIFYCELNPMEVIRRPKLDGCCYEWTQPFIGD